MVQKLRHRNYRHLATCQWNTADRSVSSFVILSCHRRQTEIMRDNATLNINVYNNNNNNNNNNMTITELCSTNDNVIYIGQAKHIRISCRLLACG